MRKPRNKLMLMSVLCIVTPIIFVAAFSGKEFRSQCCRWEWGRHATARRKLTA